jgi:hypothetical protein
MITVLLRNVIIVVTVVAGLVALYLSGDFMQSREKRRTEASEAIKGSARTLLDSKVAEEIVAAFAYAETCALTTNDTGIGNTLRMKGLTLKTSKTLDVCAGISSAGLTGFLN